MFKYIIQQTENANWSAVVSLLTFVLVFVGMLFLVSKLRKSHVDKMAHLPLEEDTNE